MAYKTTETHIYGIEDVLGRGYTGEVYRGVEKISGKVHALKVCESKFSTLVQREVQTLSRLEHPNIVRVFRQEREVGTGKPVLVVELCDNGNLLDLLYKPENGFGLGEQDYLNFFHDLVAAVRYIRENEILHRDIKPGNILVSKDDSGKNVFKLSDFAEAIPLKESETYRGVAGTDAYLHPDLFKEAYIDKKKRQMDYDEKTDLWSIGVTLYHVATGEVPFRPFQGRFDRDTMYEMISTKPADMVSGQQISDNGPIVWKTELPPTSRLTRNLKDTVAGLVKDLCVNEFSKPYTFSDLFTAADDLFRSKRLYYCIPGYHVNALYINDNTNVLELLKCLIAPSSDIDFVFDGKFLNIDSADDPIPSSSLDNPVIVIPYCTEIESQEDELSLEITMKYAQQSGGRSFSQDPNIPNLVRDAAAAKSLMYVIALVLRSVHEASAMLEIIHQTLCCLQKRTNQTISRCKQHLDCIQMFCDNHKAASQRSHKHYISSYDRFSDQSVCSCVTTKPTLTLPASYTKSGKLESNKTSEKTDVHNEKCIYYKLEGCQCFLKNACSSIEKDSRHTRMKSINTYRLESCVKVIEDLQAHFKSFRDKSNPPPQALTVHKHNRAKVLRSYKESVAILKEVNTMYKKELRSYQKSLKVHRDLKVTLEKMEASLQKCLKDLSLGTLPSELQLAIPLPQFNRQISKSDEYLSSHSFDDEEPSSLPHVEEEEYFSTESTKEEMEGGRSEVPQEDRREKGRMGRQALAKSREEETETDRIRSTIPDADDDMTKDDWSRQSRSKDLMHRDKEGSQSRTKEEEVGEYYRSKREVRRTKSDERSSRSETRRHNERRRSRELQSKTKQSEQEIENKEGKLDAGDKTEVRRTKSDERSSKKDEKQQRSGGSKNKADNTSMEADEHGLEQGVTTLNLSREASQDAQTENTKYTESTDTNSRAGAESENRESQLYQPKYNGVSHETVV